MKRESFKIVYIFAKRFDDFYLTFSRLFIFGRQKIVNSNVIKLSRFFFILGLNSQNYISKSDEVDKLNLSELMKTARNSLKVCLLHFSKQFDIFKIFSIL